MVRANKSQIKNIGTKMSNIDGENFRMNYINVNHLVWLYDKPTQSSKSQVVALMSFDSRFSDRLIARFALEEGFFGAVVGADIFVMFSVVFSCSFIASIYFSLAIHSSWLAQTQ